MYCRKCNNLMNDNEIICSKCGFDNKQDINYMEEDFLANEKSNTIRKIKLCLFMVSALIISILICFFIFSDLEPNKLKSNNDENYNQEVNTLNDVFIFHDVKVKYPSDDYGTSTNTIFFKNNNNYKIEFKILNEKEYNKINVLDLISSKLGNISTKMGDVDNGFTHLFSVNDRHYLITVSYDYEDTLEGLERQLELTKIINTLEENTNRK